MLRKPLLYKDFWLLGTAWLRNALEWTEFSLLLWRQLFTYLTAQPDS